MEDEDLLVLAAKNNTTEWNTLKFAEELFECGEAVIKYSTKKGSNKPSLENMAKEFIDVMLRGTMFFAKEFPDDEIDKILETYLEKKEQGIINRFQSKPGAKDA
jgi:NTP pyrophosphatase (non-canonical NTP hydrolase)